MHLVATPRLTTRHLLIAIDKAKPRAWTGRVSLVQARGVSCAFRSMALAPDGDWHHDPPRNSSHHP